MNATISREQCSEAFRVKPECNCAARKIILAVIITVGLVVSASVSLAGAVPPQLLSARDSSVPPPAGGDGDSCGAAVSPDGRFVVFSSGANDLVPENDRQFYMNVYLRDRASNTTALASVSLNGTSGGDADSLYGQISTNGRYVLFESRAGNLAAGFTNFIGDIYAGRNHHSGQWGDQRHSGQRPFL
jgi:hypothetical protein